MDPASVSQRALATWAEEMGFINLSDATGPVPSTSIYAVAALTPERRRLWELITRNVKDRRLVKKLRNIQSNQKEIDVLKERMQETMNKIEKVEADVIQCEERCKSKIKNIKVHEEWEKENGKKVILAHMRKRQNSEIIKSLALLRENLSQVSQPHNQVTSSDATDWLNGLITELQNKWSHVGLAEEIKHRIQNDQMESNALWEALIEKVRNLKDKVLVEIEQINKHRQNFLTNLPSSFMSWETYLEKQKNNCAIMDDLILLIKGVGLHEMTSSRNSHKDRILKSVEKCLTFVPVEPMAEEPLDDFAVERLRLESHNTRMAYESVEHNVNSLISWNSELFKKGLSSRKELLAMKIRKQDFVVNNASIMQAQVMRLTELSENQKSKLSDGRLNNLPSDHEEKIEVPTSDNQNCQELLPHLEAEISISELLELLCKNEDPNLDGIRGRKLMRSLSSTKNRLMLLFDKLENCRRIEKLREEQPFGRMIPDSYTVSGLTYKEWKMQSSMSMMPMDRQDQSCFPLDFTVTRNSYLK